MRYLFSSSARSKPRRSRSERSRRASVEHLEGRALLTAAEFELSSLLPANGGDGSAGFVVSGTAEQGRLGVPSDYRSVGDVNQDGVDDLLVSSPGPGFATPSDIVGEAFLIFGRPDSLPPELDIGSLDGTSGYVIQGAEPGDRLGASSGGAAGDINADGLPDIVIASDGRSSSGDRLDGGRTFVLFGGTSHLAALDLADGSQDGRIGLGVHDGAHGFAIEGVAAPGVEDFAGSLSGKAAAAGDVNADGVDDLVIGSWRGFTGNPEGQVFVVYGRGPGSTAGLTFPAVVQLAALDGSDGFEIPALPSALYLGSAVAGAGDVNGDGIADLVLGAYFADPGARQDAGQAYVIFGRPTFPAVFDLASLDGNTGFTVNGKSAGDYLGGFSVDGAGDVNGDGIDDVLIGSWGVDGPSGSSAGAAYVIFGKTTTFGPVIEVSTLNGSNGFALLQTGQYARSAGDVNGDGYQDLITGQSHADPNGLTDAGQSYVVYGAPSLGSSFDVTNLLTSNGGDGTAGYALNGYLTGGKAAYVAGIGDINGDGLDDIGVGAPFADLDGLTDNGQAYVVFGKLSPTPPPPLPTKFYVVNDATTNRTYEYGPDGSAVEDYALNSGNTAPRGAAGTAAGDRVWVVDANKKVYVYDTAGALLGSWTAGSLASNATVEGIATNGTDVWIVDARQDRVYRYSNAAGRLSGSQNAVGNFALNGSNKDPKDVVTDGSSLWVVNNSSTDKVFKYTLTGSLLGSWTISGAGSSPTGITLDPSGGGNLWVVDNGTDRVYQFDDARGRTSGSQSPSMSFVLAAGNTNPQGIADPPAGAGLAEGSRTGTPHDSRLGVIDRALGDLGRSATIPAGEPVLILPASPTTEEALGLLAAEFIRGRRKRV